MSAPTSGHSDGTPSIDNLDPTAINVLRGEFWSGDFHQAMRWMRLNDPLFFDGQVWCASTYELVREISRQPRLFGNGEGCRPDAMKIPMMIDFDDPEHLRRRKLVNSGFTPRQVRDSEPAVRRACTEIIDAVLANPSPTCDFVADIAALLPMIMIGDALGVAPQDRAQLLEWSDDMVKGLVGSDGDAIEQATVAYMAFREFAEGAIEARRMTPTDDLMSLLVHAEIDGDRLDDESIIHESLLILIGGDETTRHVISGGMYQLLMHPEQCEELRNDRSLLPVAVEEILRWVSPIRNMNRTVMAPTELAGKSLEVGDKILLMYPSANRDEKVFEDPYRFNIKRTPNEHIAFGFGTHFCLGNSLARLELTTMFDEILTRLPDLRLLKNAEPKNRAANFVSGYEEMMVTTR
jgi:cytochrome P450 family 142 subfamily A polypeptide 1